MDTVTDGASRIVPVSDDTYSLRVEALRDAFVASRKSPHTREAYRRDITGWLDWCRAGHVDPLNARPAFVLSWVSRRREAGEAEATLARRTAAVSSWYQYLLREEVVAANPVNLKETERPRVNRSKSPSLALSTAQAEHLLTEADRDPDPRTAAIVSLLLFTGMRVGEMIAANVGDLTQQSGHPVLPIAGKGNRERTIPLPPSVYMRLDRYLRARTDAWSLLPAVPITVDRRGYAVEPLIATLAGRRIQRNQVWRILRRLARQAGGDLAQVMGRLSPHSLRHSYATDLLNAEVPIRDVQKALGHASTGTTQLYDHGELEPERHPTYRRAAQLKGQR